MNPAAGDYKLGYTHINDIYSYPFTTEIQCPSSEIPPFTEVDDKASMYGYETFVTYKCKKGYSLIAGNETRECLADSQWSGLKPLCRSEWNQFVNHFHL